jgi:hypothetical protein
MQNTAWVALLRLVPPALYDSLVVITTCGQELVVQNLFRMEEEYLVIRGRMAGTSDTGRILFIPYNQINYVGFQKVLKEAEVAAIYEGTYTDAADSVDGESADGAQAMEEIAVPAKVEPPPPASPRPPAAPPTAPPVQKQSKQASRTVLLERVRARLKAQADQSKPPNPG